MKAAIDFRRARPAFSRKNVVLTRRSQWKSRRLTYETNSSLDRSTRRENYRHANQTPSARRFGGLNRVTLRPSNSIYRLHCSRVYSICLRMLRDPVEAEDLTHESVIQLFRKIHTFRGESALSTWLHRLTVNLVLMRLRKKKLVSTSLDELTGNDEEDDSQAMKSGRLIRG